MKCSGDHLFTPVYLKLNDDMPWPQQEKVFYLLSSDGLFLCRNNAFFHSCVPVADFPSELAKQQPFLRLSYPRIPRQLMELVIGFFDLVGERFASEAAVLVVWNRDTDAVEILVPDQVGLVGTSWYGNPYPMELEYKVPSLPPHLVLLGDVHSHVDGAAYASGLDKSDEAYRPGVHLVVGRILEEPPQFHCEVVADGFRFRVRDLGLVLEGYHRRRVKEVPPEWIAKLSVKPWSSKYRYDSNGKADSRGSSFQGADSYSSSATSHQGDLEARPLRQPGPNHAEPPSPPVGFFLPGNVRLGSEGMSAKKTGEQDQAGGPEPPESPNVPPAL